MEITKESVLILRDFVVLILPAAVVRKIVFVLLPFFDYAGGERRVCLVFLFISIEASSIHVVPLERLSAQLIVLILRNSPSLASLSAP